MEFLGRDLDLGFSVNDQGCVRAGLFSNVDLRVDEREDVAPRTRDLSLIEGLPALMQALILRLKTEQGELARLGHPDYGSRHHRLVGEPNTESNRNLLRLFLIEVVQQEPRIDSILRVELRQPEGSRGRDEVEVSLDLQVGGVSAPLNLVVPFSFREALE